MFAESINTKIAVQFGLRSPKGDVGIEIETEGQNLPAGKVTGTFTGKEDGSLRNGMEYVSSPIMAKSVTKDVDYLAETLRVTGAIINPTYRSSTHIHVNYCDHTWKHVLGTTIIWALVEPIVFRMMPPGRDGSLFCVSSYDSGDQSAYIDRLCTDIGKGFYNGFNPRGKYSSLNNSRLSDLGTLEYRVFPTSLDGQQIQGWVDMCMNIRELSGTDDILGFVRDVEQRPLPFLENVFGDLPELPDLPQLVDFGARSAYEMASVVVKHLKAPAPKTRSKISKALADDGFMALDMNAVEAAAQPAEPFPPAARGLGGFAFGGAARPLDRRRRRPAAPAEPDMVGGEAEVAIDQDPRIARWLVRRAAYVAQGHDGMVRECDRMIRARRRMLADQAAAVEVLNIPHVNEFGEAEF